MMKIRYLNNRKKNKCHSYRRNHQTSEQAIIILKTNEDEKHIFCDIYFSSAYSNVFFILFPRSILIYY